ncbi:MAG: hypothetical protein ILNGONEN_02475 [Syntrophorhabdaceae bacterium]|nr:hypothetical protein [Syntrophorhabdaceae bacterium]HOG39996.1 PRTRC system protein C [Syntrophorhabdaceae bacterium]
MEALARTFRYNTIILDDPDPDMTPEQVKEFYANIYPELTQANIEGPELAENGLNYKFNRSYGTKGAITVKDLLALSAGENNEDNASDMELHKSFGYAVTNYNEEEGNTSVPSSALTPLP